jgi:hypothetical protein
MQIKFRSTRLYTLQYVYQQLVTGKYDMFSHCGGKDKHYCVLV